MPVLLVVSSTGKMYIFLSAFAPENLVSRDDITRLLAVVIVVLLFEVTLVFSFERGQNQGNSGEISCPAD